LIKLYDDIVDYLKSSMKTPPEWIGPEFPQDLLGGCRPGTACQTIWVTLDTAMFSQKIAKGMEKEEVDRIVKETTDGLIDIIWSAFDGKYEVEVAINSFDKNWMNLKLPKKEGE
jgi:hypothetical protein